MRRHILYITLLLSSSCFAQNEDKTPAVTLSGSVQSDMMIAPQQDKSIGTAEYDNNAFLTNTYVDLMLQSKRIDAGGRFEFNQFPMPGYNDSNNQFKGWGLANIWMKAKLKKTDITLGSFYEQFGSGFILRSYEERSLGIDNSLLGVHIAANPFKGTRVKVLSGLQRNYWKLNKTLISGADVEVSLDECISSMQENDTYLTLGASWVNKRESTDEEIYADMTHKLVFPEFVNAFDVRARFQSHGFSALAEYAYKSQDPNSLNSYIYASGHAELLSLSYVKSGLSILAQAKRSENMGFRSLRSENPASNACYINHLPAFTVDQTYSLAALYPYSTQTEGEWAYQGSAAYKLKGRYAPKFKLNYSLVTGLENARQNKNNPNMLGNYEGAKSKFFKNGETYYQDLDIMYEQKYNKFFELHAMYMYQQYNKGVIQSEGGNIYSHIFVADGKYRFNKKYTLRAEAQFLYTKHESGNWGFGLLELSVAPYLMFTVSDQIGKCEPTPGEYGDVTHYYNVSVTGNYKSHRLQLGYGRTRAGYNCNGGVCRYIPASKGVTLSYNYNF